MKLDDRKDLLSFVKNIFEEFEQSKKAAHIQAI